MTTNIMDRFRLDDQVAVVTGGTGLYGTGFCRALAEAGATVVITSRDLRRAEVAAAELRTGGSKATGMALDQASPDSISEFAAQLGERFGAVDVLVNNAVHRQGGGLFDTTVQDWEATAAANARGLFLLTQALAGPMVSRGSGSIINIASIHGLVAPDFPVYAGTDITSPVFYAYDKGGMIAMTRYLASALGRSGIRVNCLCPGGMAGDDEEGPFIDAYRMRTPLGRMANDGDVSGALVFLASDAARYITGVSLPVDGGWTIR